MAFKVVLEFQTEDDAKNWIAGYLDGGGDQTLGYVADLDVSVWRDAAEYKLVLKGYRQCPDCRFGDIGTMGEWLEYHSELMELLPEDYKVLDPTKTHKCQNCNCECNEEGYRQ